MGINLRKCTISDLEVLIDIAKSTFITAFENENNPDDFWSYVQNTFTEDNLRSQLTQKGSSFYFVYSDEVLSGYFKINEAESQTELNDPNSLELERIYVKKEFQGANIGTWMLQKVIQMAKKANKQYLWLGVWEHNPRAIRFYERNGFVKFGTHPYYIGNDKQTDWLLRLEL